MTTAIVVGGGPGGLGMINPGYLDSWDLFSSVLTFLAGFGMRDLRDASIREAAVCNNTSTLSLSFTWRKLGDSREGCVCTLSSPNVVACPCSGIFCARAARSRSFCMSSAASSCRSSAQPSAPEGVRTRRNRRRCWRISNRSPCFTVAITGDCSGMSLRILRTAGPTKASPIEGVWGAVVRHEAIPRANHKPIIGTKRRDTLNFSLPTPFAAA